MMNLIAIWITAKLQEILWPAVHSNDPYSQHIEEKHYGIDSNNSDYSRKF